MFLINVMIDLFSQSFLSELFSGCLFVCFAAESLKLDQRVFSCLHVIVYFLFVLTLLIL